MFGLDDGETQTLLRLACATADESNANADGSEYDRALASFADPGYVHRLAYTTWERIVSDDQAGITEPTRIAVFEAAGKTLDELQAAFRFEVVHEEDTSDPRPLVRELRFHNLVEAVEFTKLFNSGDQGGVWFTHPDDVRSPFDEHVHVSVTFTLAWRLAVVHGEDDMRTVARDIAARRVD